MQERFLSAPVLFGDWIDAQGRTDEDIAAELSAKLGKLTKPRGVKLWRTRTPPKAWAEALGITAPTSDLFNPEPSAATDGVRQSDTTPPTPPPGTPIGSPQTNLTSAQERIADTYRMVFGGLSFATGNDGYAAVGDTYSPHVAKAWIAAAEENEYARKFVRFMGSGGATGELVMCHVILIAGLLYVSGTLPDIGGPFARFRGYRPPEKPTENAAEPDDAGREPAVSSAGNPVDDARGSS